MMLDPVLSWLAAALWAFLFAAYGARVSLYGRFRAERVAAIGGTALVGEGMMNATYWAIAPLINLLVRMGVTASAVTWTALALGIAAAIAVGAGWFGLACLLATLSTVCDLIDGQVARAAGTGSKRGGLLDSVVDRYTEFAFIMGFIVFAHGRQVEIVIACAALLASFMSSYATAKAEALGLAMSRGLMRRHERAVFLILGAGVTPLLGPVLASRWPELEPSVPFVAGLAIVAVIGNVAVLARFHAISRALGHAPRP